MEDKELAFRFITEKQAEILTTCFDKYINHQEYDKSKLIAELEKNGISKEQAEYAYEYLETTFEIEIENSIVYFLKMRPFSYQQLKNWLIKIKLKEEIVDFTLAEIEKYNKIDWNKQAIQTILVKYPYPSLVRKEEMIKYGFTKEQVEYAMKHMYEFYNEQAKAQVEKLVKMGISKEDILSQLQHRGFKGFNIDYAMKDL